MARNLDWRKAQGMSIREEGDVLVYDNAGNHLNPPRTTHYVIVDGPAEIGNRWYARSVTSMVDDDGVHWLTGVGTVPGRGFGDPEGMIAWRERPGERWTDYS